MASFRKIMIDGKRYWWKYSYDDYDCQNDSTIIAKSDYRRGKLIVHFKTGGYCRFRGVRNLSK